MPKKAIDKEKIREKNLEQMVYFQKKLEHNSIGLDHFESAKNISVVLKNLVHFQTYLDNKKT